MIIIQTTIVATACNNKTWITKNSFEFSEQQATEW
ncbi:hypothetical protein [Ureaplasma parvum]